MAINTFGANNLNSSIQLNEALGGQQEWHRGTAVRVSPSMTVDDQLKAAGLDWEVVTSGFRYGEGYQYRQTDTKVAYRSTDGMFIDTYTDRQPWQNRDIINHFNQFCNDAGYPVTHIGSLQDGKTLYAAAKLDYKIDVAKVGDVSDAYLILKDSHLNGKGLSVSLFVNRLVCTNGMLNSVRQGNQVISHVGSFSTEKISAIMEAAIDTLKQKEDEATRLAQVAMSREEAITNLILAFGAPGEPVADQPKQVQTMLRLFDGMAKGSEYMSAYNTAYGLLQSVTEYFNWHAPARGNAQTQLQSLIAGSRAQKMKNFERQLVTACF